MVQYSYMLVDSLISLSFYCTDGRLTVGDSARQFVGGGVQSRNVDCVQPDENDNEKITNDFYCNGTGPRPATRRDCNTHSCGQWSVSEWGTCNRRCGNGGSQTRTVACMNVGGAQINPINCHHVKPSSVRPCNNGPCDYRWKKEPWGQVRDWNVKTRTRVF